GSRTAKINGQSLTLDVPAMEYGGSTMVPLRFLGEALGAQILWDAGTQTVMISTDNGATSNPPTSGMPPPGETGQAQITSFTHNSQGWLKSGAELRVTLLGTQGGAAFFQIPGVVNQVAMREESAGVYTGTWTVPANKADMSISDASVLGTLRIAGKDQLIQAAKRVSVDSNPPQIKDPIPANSTIAATNRPSISAVFDDRAGSGIDQNSVRIDVDNRDVTSSATVTQNFINLVPEQALAAGVHTVTVSALDNAGNQASQSWKFSVTNAKDIITAVGVIGGENPQPGDVITVGVTGVPGAAASFSIGASGTKIPLTEVSAGRYKGTYTVRRGEDISGQPVVATLKTKDGQVFTQQAENKLGGQAVAPPAPVITSPVDRGKVQSSLVIAGTAQRGSKVRLSVDYVRTVFGVLGLNGTLAEQVVDVDQNGKFVTKAIDLSSVKGKNTEFTITATAENIQGEVSEPAVVVVTGS
ncbi:MAG: stalk domain-containing protein, partial [Armatimonadota bacterium]